MHAAATAATCDKSYALGEQRTAAFERDPKKPERDLWVHWPLVAQDTRKVRDAGSSELRGESFFAKSASTARKGVTTAKCVTTAGLN